MLASAALAHAPMRHEGLGLGGVSMPLELGGSSGPAETSLFDTRHKGVRASQPRHSPSLSSPADLAPFAASLRAGSAPSAMPKSRMSVVGSTPSAATHGLKRAVKHLSGDYISYPVVSRIDMTSTYTPPPAVPPIPTSALAKTPRPPTPPSSGGKKASKARPPPIKVNNSTHSSFLSPLKSRFGKGGKDKENSADWEKPELDEDEQTRSQSRKSKVDTMIAENNAAFKAAFPDVVAGTRPAPSPANLNTTLPSKIAPPSNPTPIDPGVRATLTAEPSNTTGIALGSPFHDPSASSSSDWSARPIHRRGTSDESPQVVQNAFARIAELDDERLRPATMFSAAMATPSQSRRPSVAAGSSTESMPRERSKSASGAGMPSFAAPAKVDDAFFPTGAAPASTATPSASRRPSFVPRTLDAANSIGISVREGPAAPLREVGRAAFSPDGVAVSLRSYHRPEELEVGWVCTPCVDEEGRPYTTWEIRLKPRTTSAVPAVPPFPPVSAQSSEAARARTSGMGSTTFLNYRMNAPPLTSAGEPCSMYPPTSSASRDTRRPSHTSPTTPTSIISPRKLSGRSEASSQGGSFSSDSSLAIALGRKPKLSVSSIATSVADEQPPFDLEAIKQAAGIDDLSSAEVLLSSSRQRINRSSSYAPDSEGFPRGRQFSIDEEDIMGRAVSFSVGSGVAHRPKSPKHHRFGAYIPPVSQTGGAEFAQLAQQAKRESQQAREGAVDGHEGEFAPGPATASPDRRARKQSLAADLYSPMPPLSAANIRVCESGDDADGEEAATPTKGFLAAARAGRRKQSIAPPAALVILPPSGGNGGVVSPSSGKTVVHRSPLGAPPRSSDVFGPTIDLRTPTKAHVSTLPPLLPLPDLPTSVERPSTSSSESSFVGGLAAINADDSEVDLEVEDVENASIRLAEARQARRMMSHWSETDDDDDQDCDGDVDAPGLTSWSRVPDATMAEEGA